MRDNKMRDKLQLVVIDAINDSAGYRSDVITDAIIAALPDMVAPLVWVETRHKSPDQLGCRSSAIGISYVIISALMRGNCILSSGGLAHIGPFHFDTIDEAKAAANAHHRAAIMAAFGGDL